MSFGEAAKLRSRFSVAYDIDFYQQLRAVTPDLLHDLFATNTFWDLKIERASTKEKDSGTWEVTLEVNARKETVDTVGNATTIEMNDWIGIGVFALHEGGESSSRFLYLQKHRITSGKQTIIIDVPERPSRAGIDPNHLIIDLDMGDNVTETN